MCLASQVIPFYISFFYMSILFLTSLFFSSPHNLGENVFVLLSVNPFLSLLSLLVYSLSDSFILFLLIHSPHNSGESVFVLVSVHPSTIFLSLLVFVLFILDASSFTILPFITCLRLMFIFSCYCQN